MADNDFRAFLARSTGHHAAPHNRPWQCELAASASCGNRMIRIPTGFGKTLGVLSAWAWHRVYNRNGAWPRRLVWCLPTRVLVEQTQGEVRSALERLGLLWDGNDSHDGNVGVHLVMGGTATGRWHLYPEADAVLIGTQDMLLSRAMNRGYASPRARWPMEFGLLNQDALWVMDEVQLMDAGLATSGQLQAFRDEDARAGKTLRPCFTWWMSATLQHSWLKTSPDTARLNEELAQNTHRIKPEDRHGELWDGTAKPIEFLDDVPSSKALAQDVSKRHRESGCGKDGPTLIVLNTVKRAVEVWNALKSDKKLAAAATDLRLVHSRFRPAERASWSNAFLNRTACGPETNRIVVATQVIEAGVDVSASLLVTELAPWASLVQRFGRCARWGGSGQVVVADFGYETDKKAAPYSKDQLDAARDACEDLSDAAAIHLERFEEKHEDQLPRLYPYEPKHLILRHELDDLFDTSPDLSGADIDISRFIRAGDERDLQVFWAEVGDEGPPLDMKPTQHELCSVPFLLARDWLCGKSERLRPKVGAWVWDWLDRNWRRAERTDLRPGQTVLVECRVGGYTEDRGWDLASEKPVAAVESNAATGYGTKPCWRRDGDGWRPSTRSVRRHDPADHADDAEDDESLSATAHWQTVATHGLQVGEEAQRIAREVAPDQARLLHLAGRWHDLGKAHRAFQSSIRADARPDRQDIAKAPDIAWPCSTRDMYRIDPTDQRRGFRHELASVLGLFGALQRWRPQHEALIGPWRDWLDVMGEANGHNGEGEVAAKTEQPTAIEQEIIDLTADAFDLLAYLVCAHHGKVRMAWHSSPADQQANDGLPRIRGVRQGDFLPPVQLAGANGESHLLPATALDLSPAEAGLSPRTGRSWTERVLNLTRRFGPFALAWLETLLRAADQRASANSRHDVVDPLLTAQENEDGRQALGGGGTMAQPAGGRTAPSPPRSDSPPCGELHGHGRRAGGRGVDSATTRPPHSATRYVETSAGILSYQQLAPLLAERVANVELAVVERTLPEMSIEALLLDLHQRICGDLTPALAGRWRLRDVRVSAHHPPPYWRVPVLVRNYASDLDTRLAAWEDDPERCIETLTFAEGKLLEIHPFEDFNGRVTRLLLVELTCRFDLPEIDPAVTADDRESYFAALHAYDHGDPRQLAEVWRRRLA